MELEPGSGNVFADLGLEDAPELKLKAAIAGQINSILLHRHLTQIEAADLLQIPQPKVSALKNGKLHGFSLEKLLALMVRLDRNVEIGFQKAASSDRAGYFLHDGKRRIQVAT
ncbi:helix-turn-helix domain-containing protein [Frigidibacter oleivorans]|uniref:helix-turn-helix domain-containing protein n=1 Tax=Frigidibacter oleivorans TaxID=2487129 RepID=UPI00197AAFE9|nr:helix-turn-helix transcriptional regulator [Frigidibacter oleivorans]